MRTCDFIRTAGNVANSTLGMLLNVWKNQRSVLSAVEIPEFPWHMVEIRIASQGEGHIGMDILCKARRPTRW